MSKSHPTQATLGSKILEIVGGKDLLLCTTTMFKLSSYNITVIQSVMSSRGHVQAVQRQACLLFVVAKHAALYKSMP
jgi:hypothetical protein